MIPSPQRVRALVEEEARRIPLDPDLILNPPRGTRDRFVTQVRARVARRLRREGFSFRGIAKRLNVTATAIAYAVRSECQV